jgi:acyl carrier protein
VTVEDTVKKIFNQVLDVQPNEIQPDDKLEDGLGVDSTEMVEIAVGLKKALGVVIGDNELKKSQTFDQIVAILKAKGAK